jgi:hypothetical protein
MSWDVLLLPLPAGINSIEELESFPELGKEPLGNREKVLVTLAAAEPTADLSDPSWGYLEGPGWSIELNIGDADPVDTIMLHVRGGGNIVPSILKLASALGCYALDGSSGDILWEDAAGSWADFRAYRDQVVNPPTL